VKPNERRVAAFSLPNIAHSPGEIQSSSTMVPPYPPAHLPGATLQKEVTSKVVRPSNEEQTVLSISEPCTAVDVYGDMRNVPLITAGIFYVRIYAIEGNVRSVVGRGRFNNSANGQEYDRNKLVASARVGASRFEITIAREITPGDPEVPSTSEAEFPMSAIGYQSTGGEPLAPPLHVVGVWTGFTSQQLLHVGPGEVTSMNGTNAEPAGNPARFIQLWDTAGPAGSGFLIEEIVSQPQDNWSIDYGAFPNRFINGLVIGNSTTTALVGFTANAVAFGTFVHEVR
jgi:hypothetical protein